MNVEFVVLRLLHIVFGAFWVGSAVFLAAVLEPRLRALGPAIQRPVMRELGRVMGPVIGISGLITISAGITLALRLRWDTLDKWFSTGWGWAILIGFIASMLAMAAGGATDATGRRMGQISSDPEQGPPSPEQIAEMQRLGARLTTLVRAAAVLVLIAVGSMASARFVG